ncbi:MAG: hypothetical protein ACLU7D_04525 [Collinsella sp.]
MVVNISRHHRVRRLCARDLDDVKARVTERLAAMTGLEVAGVNRRIEDVITPRVRSTAPASTSNLLEGTGLFWQVLSTKTLNGRPRAKAWLAALFHAPDVGIPLV